MFYRTKLRSRCFSLVIFVVFCLSLILIFDSFERPPLLTELNVLRQKCYDKTLTKNLSLSPGVNRVAKMYFPQSLDTEKIQEYIQQHNRLQTILNEDKYGPLQNDSLVIVVQVHKRLNYLKYAIATLAQSEGIENTLLIFSHDYYDEEINYNIQSIKFCKVMQIFFPYSIQTHPNQFPGLSPNDCPLKISQHEAIKMKCNNALHPDTYGHYRNSHFTQTKHHWWWKANRIFDGLQVTKYYTGLIAFLEEDDYLVPDFIHILHLMENLRQSECPNCRVFSLGPRTMNVNYSTDADKAETHKWISRSDLVLAFNRSFWKELKACAEVFCTYDDYNWDWTMAGVSNKCIPGRITAIVLKAPRSFHLGDCGTHGRSNNCENLDKIKKIQKILWKSSKYFFPQQLFLYTETKNNELLREPPPYGGWGDVRDHNLCLNMTRMNEL